MTVATERELSAAALPSGLSEQPRLIFATEQEGEAALAALRAPGVLAFLAARGHAVALRSGSPW